MPNNDRKLQQYTVIPGARGERTIPVRSLASVTAYRSKFASSGSTNVSMHK